MTRDSQTTRGDRSRADDARTRVLLAGGVLAGPLFVLVAAIQVVTRDGFDLSRHPISLLSLGELGWIQITNFVVTGLLVVACAGGVRRAMHPGRAGTWGPILVLGVGVGLVAGGAFLADPYLGFPLGTPTNGPAHPSWHGAVHNIAPGLALDAAIVAGFVFARRYVGLRERAMAGYCVATSAAILALSFWPSRDGISVRLAVAITLALAMIAVISVSLARQTRS
jgi:hypothetical protein